MIATLSSFGANSGSIWIFAGGILTIFLTVIIVLAGINLIKRLIDIS